MKLLCQQKIFNFSKSYLKSLKQKIYSTMIDSQFI